jgi:hypothetical protein
LQDRTLDVPDRVGNDNVRQSDLLRRRLESLGWDAPDPEDREYALAAQRRHGSS